MSNSQHVSALRMNFKNLIKFDSFAVEYSSEDSEPSDIRESEDSVLQWQLAQQRKEDKAMGYGAEVLFPGDKVPRLTRKVSNTSMA